MKRLAILLMIGAAAACAGPAPPSGAAQPYLLRPGSPGGIGKFYMGREIAHVASSQGEAAWLDRPDRVEKERTDLLVHELPLRPADVVVDLGAGTGVLSLQLARRVPQGRVLAVDIQPEMLDILRARIASESVPNVEPVLADETDPHLPAGAVDLVLMVDAYHEFSFPREVMQHVVTALKPQGRVALVEYRGEDPRVPVRPLHKMTEKQARKEMAAVGLRWISTADLLPRQHLMLFAKDY